MTVWRMSKVFMIVLLLLLSAFTWRKSLHAQELQGAEQANQNHTVVLVEGQELVIYIEGETNASRQRVAAVPMNKAPLVLDDYVALAPDGKSVAYVTMDNPFTRQNTTLWVKEPGESLAQTSAQPVVTIPSGFWLLAPIWSPDSKQLLYIQEFAPVDNQVELEIWLVQRESGQPRLIWSDSKNNQLLRDALNAGFPDIINWSQDGQSVYVNNQAAAPPMLATIELASGSIIQQETNKQAMVQSAALETDLPCDVPLFHQTGNNTVMRSCNQTISAVGCAVTSTAMVFKYFGVNTDPTTLSNCLGNSACNLPWSVAASNCSEGKIQRVELPAFSYSRIDQELAAKRPVIVGMSGHGTTHFVVVKSGGGGNADGYAINDPARYNIQRERLSAYTNEGWTLTGLRIYSGTPACSNGGGDNDGGDISYGQSKNGTINPAGDTDDYYFNVTAGDIVEIRQNKNNSSLDSYVELYGPDDRLVAVDDDTGGSYNSFLRRTLSSGGRYRIRAKAYGSSTGAYNLSLNKSGTDGGSSNSCGGDCEGDPRTIAFGQTLNGTINPNNDRDSYHFNGTTGRVISIRMNRTGGSLDSYVELWGPNGVKVAENDDGGGNQNSWLVYTLPGDGTYRISAYSYNNASSGTYSLKLESVTGGGGSGNYARGKPVAVSSVESGGLEGWKATDGNINSRWSSRFSDPQYIYVDLGQDRTISQVVLKWETAFARQFSILIQSSSMCNSCWTNVYSTNSGGGSTNTINFAPVRARYVLMYGTQRGTPWGYSLWEFEVYDTTSTPLPEVPPDDEGKAPNDAPEEQPLAPVEGDKDVILGGNGELGQEETPLASDEAISITQALSGTQNVIAYILSPDPDQLYRLYTPAGQIRFSADANSLGADGAADIAAYEWRSDVDGVLGNQEEFLLPIGEISLGVHTISLRVQNAQGEWSSTVTTTLVVEWPNQVYLPVITR